MSDSDDDLDKMLEEKAALEKKIQAALKKKERAVQPVATAPEKPASTSEIMDAYVKEREGKSKRKRKPKANASTAIASVEPAEPQPQDFFESAPVAKPSKRRSTKTQTVDPPVADDSTQSNDEPAETADPDPGCSFEEPIKEDKQSDAPKQG
ncbi:MAG: hypothetical protein K2Z81_26145, partial [Cyanobacteria bacterium]|nr:hypothetical protein [Cyanobacteriota bacterium]